MKRWTSLLLALILALVTCSAALGAETDDRFGKFEEPIEVTYLSLDHSSTVSEYDGNNPSRKSAQENAWIDGYYEQLGIKLNRIIAEDATALSALINTAMASGDLPDIICCDKSMFYVLAENGVLQDLSGVYENYEHKNFLTQIEDTYPSIMQVGMYDGEVLGYPKVGNCYNNSEVLWVRQDWLDAVEMEAPATLEELGAVARAFVDAKLGGENTVGIGLYNIGESILAAHGAVMNIWEEQADGSYVYGNVDEKAKDGLLEMKGFYADGLIKNDFAVASTLDEDVANGACGMFFGAVWRGVTCVQTNLNNDPDAVWIPVHIPTLDGAPVDQWTNNAVGTYFCVNADFEYPEALFMLIEFENAMRFSDDPVESATYNVCGDGYQMWNLGAFRDAIRADTDLYKGELIAIGLENNTPAEEMDPLARSNYEMCLQAVKGDRSTLGRLVAFVDGYGVTIPLLAGGYLKGEYNGPLTDNMTLYQGAINEALKNAMIKVIMGEDISVYEQAVEQWYATGGQTITDEVNAYYEGLK